MRRPAAVLALSVAVLLAGCGQSSTDGSVLYSSVCATCHGADLGGGSGPAIDGSSPAASKTDGELLSVIQFGARGMPSARGLTDEQLDALVDYVRQEQGR